MVINVRDDARKVEVYLTNAEKDDPKIGAELKDIYAEYKKKDYLVSVFKSGEGELYTSIRDLLLWNRRRMAERETQQARKPHTVDMER